MCSSDLKIRKGVHNFGLGTAPPATLSLVEIQIIGLSCIHIKPACSFLKLINLGFFFISLSSALSLSVCNNCIALSILNKRNKVRPAFIFLIFSYFIMYSNLCEKRCNNVFFSNNLFVFQDCEEHDFGCLLKMMRE